MKNLERAKNYQKKLYNALGKQWDEKFFSDYWEATLMGHEWDTLYDRGYLENDFCAWCGNDGLKNHYYRQPNFSARGVKVFICDECFFKATGGNVLPHQMSNSRKSGCFIATAVYGSYSHPSVIILQQYRDLILSKNIFGRLFIRCYYFFGPSLAKKISKHLRLSSYLRNNILNPFIIFINKKYFGT